MADNEPIILKLAPMRLRSEREILNIVARFQQTLNSETVSGRSSAQCREFFGEGLLDRTCGKEGPIKLSLKAEDHSSRARVKPSSTALPIRPTFFASPMASTSTPEPSRAVAREFTGLEPIASTTVSAGMVTSFPLESV